MQDLKITLVQSDQFWEDKEANLSHFDDLLSGIEQTDLILLPEMFHTGFTMNAEEMAEEMDDSMGINWLKESASRMNSAIYTSLIIRENEQFFNRGVFVFPDESIELYDKRKTFGLAGEDKVFQSGGRENIVEYKGWRINLQICYDLRFPEIVRNKINEEGSPNYDIVLYVANWPEKRSEHWKSLLRARAIENQAYVIGVNRIGKDAKELKYSGDSMLIDPLGKIQGAKMNDEMVFTVNVSKSFLTEVRENLPFLKDI